MTEPVKLSSLYSMQSQFKRRAIRADPEKENWGPEAWRRAYLAHRVRRRLPLHFVARKSRGRKPGRQRRVDAPAALHDDADGADDEDLVVRPDEEEDDEDGGGSSLPACYDPYDDAADGPTPRSRSASPRPAREEDWPSLPPPAVKLEQGGDEARVKRWERLVAASGCRSEEPQPDGVFVLSVSADGWSSSLSERKLPERTWCAGSYRDLADKPLAGTVSVALVAEGDALHPPALVGERTLLAATALRAGEPVGRYFGIAVPDSQAYWHRLLQPRDAQVYMAEMRTPQGCWTLLPESEDALVGVHFVNDYRSDVRCLDSAENSRRASAVLNCEFVVVRIDSFFTLWLRTCRPVAVGEPLFVDYGDAYWIGLEGQRKLPIIVPD